MENEKKELLESITKEVESLVEKSKDGLATSKEVDAIKESIKDLYTKSEIDEIKETLNNTALELKAMKESGNKPSSSIKSQIKAFIENNAKDIESIYKSGTGFKELIIKAPETITTGNATNPDGIPEIVGVQVAPPDNVNLKQMDIVSLTTNISTNQRAYAYTESIPKEGDYEFLGEGETKPQIDFTIETRYAEPVKVAAWEQLTTEVIQDIPRMRSLAEDYLFKKHNLKKNKGILNGDGLGNNPTGATTYGRLFVPGAMLDTIEDPNIMDVINACRTDIYTTHNYQDEMPYKANLVLLNPIDFFVQFVAAKDLNGLPLFPSAALFETVTMGGVVIMPEEEIDQGDIFVCDMSKYNTTNYVPYSVRIGWINDDFINNLFVILGESRFHAFVKELDEQAFIYDSIATIKTALDPNV